MNRRTFLAATGCAALSVSVPAAAQPSATAELPEGLQQLCEDTAGDLASEPEVAALFRTAFGYTWRAAMHPLPGGYLFVDTGDIPGMWLRDSTAQLRPYLLAADDPAVADAIAATVRSQVRYVLTEPYANAFKAAADDRSNDTDTPTPGPLVWERKYEVDSLASVLQLGYGLWRATQRLDHADDQFWRACDAILTLWSVEQDHDARSPYTFVRTGPYESDTLPRDGHGGPVAPTGMTWSGFRPSDDPCRYGYIVPANALAAVSLAGLTEMASAAGRVDLAARATALMVTLGAGVRTHGVVESPSGGAIYAYEVDGLGNSVLMDDANSPSLLALPYLGWCDRTDPLYSHTRDFVLSPANPYYFTGSRASGIGSPHTRPGYVWPLAMAMAGLTATDTDEPIAAARAIAATAAGTHSVHESIDPDHPNHFTRAEFCWGDALFSELALSLTGRRLTTFFPTLVPSNRS